MHWRIRGSLESGWNWLHPRIASGWWNCYWLHPRIGSGIPVGRWLISTISVTQQCDLSRTSAMASIHLLVHFVISEQFDLGGSDTILLNHLGGWGVSLSGRSAWLGCNYNLPLLPPRVIISWGIWLGDIVDEISLVMKCNRRHFN